MDDIQSRITEAGNHSSIKMLVYADSGVGKTRFVASAEGKVLIIRPPTEQTVSIAGSGAHEIVVSDWADMEDLYLYLRQEGSKYDWVWLDSISLMQDATLDGIWEDTVALSPHRKDNGLDKREYGINMHRLGLWVRNVCAINDFNFGITAHTRELAWSENPDQDDKLMPWVQGKNMASKICGYMQIIGFYEMDDKGRRVMRFGASDRYYAKDQFDAVEKGRMLNPTLPKLEAAINAALAQRKPVAKKAAGKNKSTKSTKKTGAAGRKKA